MAWKRASFLHNGTIVLVKTWKRGGGDPGPVISRVAQRTGDKLEQITHLQIMNLIEVVALPNLILYVQG